MIRVYVFLRKMFLAFYNRFSEASRSSLKAIPKTRGLTAQNCAAKRN